MSIPVIIHYKDNGKDDGVDLRMTLRSFERFMPDMGELVIVGDRHDWMRNFTHIPFRHPYKSNKDANIMMAIIKGAAHLAITNGYQEDVVIAADDCILMSPYCNGLYFEEKSFQFMESFPSRLPTNAWWERPYQSVLHCMTFGWVADNCETHTPQFVSIGSIMSLLDARIGEAQLGAYTLIVNAERTLGHREAECVKPYRVEPCKLKPDLINDPQNRFCNWFPSAETPQFRELLASIFPLTSRYETHGI